MARLRPVIPLDQDVYSLALERMAYVMDTFDHVFVMFSGGKDSTATLNVALTVAHSDPRFARHLPLRTVFYDEEAIPFETEEYVRRVSQRDDVALEWLCLPVKHRNACSRKSPWWWPWAPEAADRWCRPLPPEAITDLPGFVTDPIDDRPQIPDMAGLLAPPELGNCAQLMGIRAAESITRHRAVTAREVDNYIVRENGALTSGNLWKVYPVFDWSTEDVWTAPAMLGWDYNEAYDRLAMAGVSPSMQRCSPAFGEEPLQKIHTYAACFPEVWDRMVDRVPGVGAAGRYALTELYSYGSRPDKPAGMPWGEFIRHYLGKFEPADERRIAERIADEIRSHYRKTTDPLVVDAPHPETGVSWNFLLGIAMRGDFKGRKQAGANVQTDAEGRTQPRYWRRYVRVLSAAIADGTFAELQYPGRPPADPDALVPAYAKETDTP